MMIESVPGILKTNWKAPARKTRRKKNNFISKSEESGETIELFVTTKQMSSLDEHQK